MRRLKNKLMYYAGLSYLVFMKWYTVITDPFLLELATLILSLI